MSERKSQQELDFERKHEEDLQRLRGLRLIDDDFMAAVFEDRTCAEFLLQIILKRDDLTVKEVHGQYSIKNLQGRSIRLDILAVDQASCDLVFGRPYAENHDLVERIQSRHGLRQLTAMAELKMGNSQYELISID